MRACTIRCGRGFDGVALPWSATNRNPPAAPKRNRYGAVLAANIVIAAVSKAKQRRSKHTLCAEDRSATLSAKVYLAASGEITLSKQWLFFITVWPSQMFALKRAEGGA